MVDYVETALTLWSKDAILMRGERILHRISYILAILLEYG